MTLTSVVIKEGSVFPLLLRSYDHCRARNCKLVCSLWTWKWKRRLKESEQGTRRRDNPFLMRWRRRRGGNRTFSEVNQASRRFQRLMHSTGHKTVAFVRVTMVNVFSVRVQTVMIQCKLKYIPECFKLIEILFLLLSPESKAQMARIRVEGFCEISMQTTHR